jgi:transcriptional regulator with XRE-family HTH domain
MTHPVDDHVGAKLRELRKSVGMSQSTLAGRLGLTFQQVQKYERGTNRVSASKLYETAAILGVPVADFFEGLSDPNVSKFQAVPSLDNDLLARLIKVFETVPKAERPKVLKVVAAMADLLEPSEVHPARPIEFGAPDH